MKSSRRVLDDRIVEVGANAIGIGDEVHVLVGGSAQSGLGSQRHLGPNGVFEMSVEPFVVIELGAVAGQVKHHAGASQMKSHDLLAPLVQRLQLLISSVFFVHDTLTSKSTKVQTSCGRP